MDQALTLKLSIFIKVKNKIKKYYANVNSRRDKQIYKLHICRTQKLGVEIDERIIFWMCESFVRWDKNSKSKITPGY